jgi:hypothetical protein
MIIQKSVFNSQIEKPFLIVNYEMSLMFLVFKRSVL